MEQKVLLLRTAIGVSLLALGACEKEIVSDEPVIAESSVSITTRSVNDGETVSFPVNVYVFNAADRSLVRHETLADKDQPFSFSIPLGSYSVYAIGGADGSRYTFPADRDVTEEATISLKEGKEHADLMTAHQNITLDNKDNYPLTLNMERQVVELTNATVSQVPADISDVSISLTSSYKSIQINGTLTGSWSPTYPLTKSGEGVWSLPSPVMMLIDPASVDITISLTKEDGSTKTYHYTSTNDFVNNYKISIEATYQDDNIATITGTIIGCTWTGNKTITFSFGDSNHGGNNNQNENDPSIINESAPAVHSLYKGCYVLKVEEKDDYDEVLLLYKEDFPIEVGSKTEAEVLQEIQEQLSTLTIEGTSGWRLHDKEEANIIIQEFLELLKLQIGITRNGYFYYILDNKLKVFKDTGILNEGLPYTEANHYTPVTTLRFQK